MNEAWDGVLFDSRSKHLSLTRIMPCTYAHRSLQVEVAQTEHFSKGNQANPTFKPATLANGETIKVPPFVETGEKVVIDTEEMEYVSRAT